MDSYSVNFKPSVQKDLRPLPEALVARVMEPIEGLKTDPFPRQAIKLSGTERLYRLRVGDYRIVYEVDTQAQQIMIRESVLDPTNSTSEFAHPYIWVNLSDTPKIWVCTMRKMFF